MAYAMTKQGSLDNCITYEFICDTIADMNAIENRYRTLGSIAVVLSGESEGLEVYIAGSDKAWNNLGSMGAGNSDSTVGLSIYICAQGEYDTNTKVPTVEEPDETSLYLVPASEESGNLYDEYVYVNNAWEKFGGGRINLSNYVQNTDIATQSTAGLVKVLDNGNVTFNESNQLVLTLAGTAVVKSGQSDHPISVTHQHEAAFYGLAKAAGQDMKNSNNAVGTYTTEAATAIRNMIGAGTYNKPSDGIPASDIASGVIPDTSIYAPKANPEFTGSISLGRKANTSVGPNSFAFGSDVQAIGPYTHAEGYYTYAQGMRAAHAEGVYTFSSANASHAEGYGTSATANGSHAEGYGADSENISDSIKRNGPSAVGVGAHAEGYGDAAGAPYASGTGAHAEGYKTLAVSQYTHAEGEGSLASGQVAHAEGQNTKATNNASHAEGIGNDYSNNGHTVSPGSFGIASHAEGYQTISASQGSHAEGYRTQATANYAHSEGNSTTASGGSAHAEGEYTKALSLGAHAEGYNTTANAIYAHAEGYGSSAIRDGAHAEGSYTHADGTYSHAEGTNSIAKGHSAHAEGYNTIASAAYSHVVGCYNIEDNLASWPEWEPSVEYNIGDKVKRAVIVDSSTVIVGYSCRTAHTSATFIQSNWDIVIQKEYVEIVGNGTANNARSNARALDWEGNERLMGDLYIGCNADSTGGTAVGTRIAALEAEVASLRAALEAILNPTSPDDPTPQPQDDTVPEDAVVMENNEPLTDEEGNVLVYDTPST